MDTAGIFGRYLLGEFGNVKFFLGEIPRNVLYWETWE